MGAITTRTFLKTLKDKLVALFVLMLDLVTFLMATLGMGYVIKCFLNQ